MDITEIIQRNPVESMTVTVKQERPDEHEINEMAAQIKAANLNKMAQMQQNQANRPHVTMRPGQQTISQYYGQDKSLVNGQSSPKDSEDDENQSLDLWSIMGRFGWTKLGKEHVPHIFRSREEYCAVKMVENKILNKYLQYLPQDVYSCTCIRSYFITENEAKLLNEINFKHCESQFGKESFTVKDLVVRLTDAEQFHNFLETCYRKICLKTSDSNDRCGFFRINGESVVPYTVKSSVKFVPLFYFEGETDNLKQKAQSVEGWELSYLKFCCKVQGIRNELFASEKCQVVSFDNIKSHFPTNTVFEDWWPQKNPLQQMGGGGMRPNTGSMWTQKAQSTPSPATPHSSGASVMYRNTWNNAPSNPVTANSRMPSVPSTMQSSMPQQRTTSASAPRPPPPLVRATAPQSRPVNPAINSMVNMVAGQMGTVSSRQTVASVQNSQIRHSMVSRPIQAPVPKPPPPPLVSVNGTNHVEEVIDIASPPGSPTSQRPYAMSRPTDNLTPIAEVDTMPHSSHTYPFKLQKVNVAGVLVTCVNFKPYVFNNSSELLMKVEELALQFFPSLTVVPMMQALQALGITVYKLNRSQLRMFPERDSDILPVLLVKDANEYMPQIKYIYNSMSEPANKRQRLR